MTARDIAFVVFGLFVALSASYVAYQIAIAVGLGVASAGPIAGLVFAVTAIMIDRKRPSAIHKGEAMPKHLEKCFLCGNKFEFGPHLYRDRKIHVWEIMVCESCYGSNHDGIVPGRFARLEPYLKRRGIEVKLNDKGWIAWPISSAPCRPILDPSAAVTAEGSILMLPNI